MNVFQSYPRVQLPKNLMIAANVPLATRMWFHNWGQAKASALSEVIYRRLLQNDIQYHQAIIARTLFTFVTAAKRHIAAEQLSPFCLSSP